MDYDSIADAIECCDSAVDVPTFGVLMGQDSANTTNAFPCRVGAGGLARRLAEKLLHPGPVYKHPDLPSRVEHSTPVMSVGQPASSGAAHPFEEKVCPTHPGPVLKLESSPFGLSFPCLPKRYPSNDGTYGRGRLHIHITYGRGRLQIHITYGRRRLRIHITYGRGRLHSYLKSIIAWTSEHRMRALVVKSAVISIPRVFVSSPYHLTHHGSHSYTSPIGGGPPDSEVYSSCLMFRSYDPLWLQNPKSVVLTVLQALPSATLVSSLGHCTGTHLTGIRPSRCLDSLAAHIHARSSFVAATDIFTLRAYISDEVLRTVDSVLLLNDRVAIVALYFIQAFGADVAAALRFVPLPPTPLPIAVTTEFPWCSHDAHERLQSKSVPELRSLCQIARIQAVRRSTKSVLVSCIWNTVKGRVLQLSKLTTNHLCSVYISLFPFATDFKLADTIDRKVLILTVVRSDYSSELFALLFTETLDTQSLLSSRDRRNLALKEERKEHRMNSARMRRQHLARVAENWPQPVDPKVVRQCLNNYHKKSAYIFPMTCAICGRTKDGILVTQVKVTADSDFATNMQILKVSEPFILQHTDPKMFLYGSSLIDGLFLEKDGIVAVDASFQTVDLNICSDCSSNISRNKLPRLAIANKLFRGTLPAEFNDLTWAEEMVCCIYRNTAHVTRLFRPSDISQNKVMHGNTCAHEMNVMSTASVLPRTPADVNEMISVVFLGSSKLSDEDMQKIPHLTVRKQKVWDFLVWLHKHNVLYMNLPPPDSDIMELYPEHGVLPGLLDRVIYDHESNPSKLFASEAAGLQQHPADVFLSDSTSGSPETVLLERMGVSDPDGHDSTGRSYQASAIRNLVRPERVNEKKDVDPDLRIYRSPFAENEYKNPKLIPGMFPTLFPLGIGGFEDPSRKIPVSLEKQSEYFLDVGNRVFRYHYSYMFVMLNILQRRTAHLHTHLTVEQSNFSSIASRLISVKPDVLCSLADRLESEKTLSDLSAEEKDAMELLNRVKTVSAKIPGSQASKMNLRSEIRSYFSHFGLPHLFFTFNPSAVHSPIFQVIYGDTEVDLNERYPVLVPPRDRALRLAQDPVAAADFYQFCVNTVLTELLGWDADSHSSKAEGGILGHVEAYYATTELTERGNFHGHFLIWLVGGMNPSDVHNRMREDKDFQDRFFAYFEDIIYHHTPDVECVIPPEYEPRVERPLKPPPVDVDMQSEEFKMWESELLTDIKKCAETLQRHSCKAVCEKYRKDGECRFQFPHEIVETSQFDSETNSIILKCLDGLINFYNRFIAVVCRHNQDLKCILSGKAAKAAMFYITDYITKMDIKTHEMLSLLSKAVMKDFGEGDSAIRQAQMLLHKCLTQFTRKQQIHAQQAARYLRGLGDGISSHRTVPMLSAMLMQHIHNSYEVPEDETEANDVHRDSDIFDTHPEGTDSDNSAPLQPETLRIRIHVGRNGKLQNTSQVEDYWYRADSLHHMSFYDFTRFVRLESRSEKVTVQRLGVLERHSLKDGHPLAKTHVLVEHTNHEKGDGVEELVPRVIGMIVPRATHSSYKLFCLAHFKPFDVDRPLIDAGSTVTTIYNALEFPSIGRKIMKNWEAMYECEDQRDAERIRKRATLTSESQAMTNSLSSALRGLADEDIDFPLAGAPKVSGKDFAANMILDALQFSNWLEPKKVVLSDANGPAKCTNEADTINIPDITVANLRQWNEQLKEQEQIVQQNRINRANPSGQTLSKVIQPTDTTASDALHRSCVSSAVPFSEVGAEAHECTYLSTEEVIDKIERDFSLNTKQRQAYRIIAMSFINKYVRKNYEAPPLRMLLTGPGGTGKTHVVRAVKTVMEHYNMGHQIRFLAPTGSAASLIDGMTIHKGLGIKITAKNRGKSNRNAGDDREDYSVVVSVKSRAALRNEWKDVELVMCDEVSLLSQELVAEVDAALRYAKEKPNELFGGISMIFAGDFYQFPPVGGTPLYTPISNSAGTAHQRQSNDEIVRRIGRLAWKSVSSAVSLTEQERMRDDMEYGAAVNRLRTRECTEEDVTLFNSRVIRSIEKLDGVDMSTKDNFDAAAIVRTNHVREALNVRKAHAICAPIDGPDLTVCAALDKIERRIPEFETRTKILKLDMTSSKANGMNALPGFIPMYVGMPVILRSRNLSTELGVTNGSQGILRCFKTSTCPAGYTYCSGAVVEFPTGRVKIPGLPPKHYPITAITWAFTTVLTDGEKVRVTRSQMPFQPGFAVTGQSAQGKTLPSVLAALHEGGFSAYVSASRARSRLGLCVMRPVTLGDLNKPISHDLTFEMKRFIAIEHNTLVDAGLSKGSRMNVPDAESERTWSLSQYGLNIARNSEPTKRKRHGDIDENPSPSKEGKTSDIDDHSLGKGPAGCVWSSKDWSCAYDSIFMICLNAFKGMSNNTRTHWAGTSPMHSILSDAFLKIIQDSSSMRDAKLYNNGRDRLRDNLSNSAPQIFPRRGPVGTYACAIMERVVTSDARRFTVCIGCDEHDDHSGVLGKVCINIPELIMHSSASTIQNWLDEVTCAEVEKVWQSKTCPSLECHNKRIFPQVSVDDAPLLLAFEVPQTSEPRPSMSMTFNLPGSLQVYDLVGIVYSGSNHFTARLFENAGVKTYLYDGQVNGGSPILQDENSHGGIHAYEMMGTRNAHLYVYRIRDSDSA